jgi:hypothetical protein
MREIQERLRGTKQGAEFIIKTAEAVRYEDLRGKILEHNPNIVHFSGWGEENSGLCLEDKSGAVKRVGAKPLTKLFKLFAGSVECVVLNASYSTIQAEAIAEHIPFAIGMEKAIGEKAAIEFSSAFYEALGEGRDYQFAYDYACTAIELAGIAESDTPQLSKKKAEGNPPPPSPMPPPPDNTTIPNTPSIMISLLRINPYLNYSTGSLAKLKSILSNLRGDAYQKGGRIEITTQQISAWLQEINQAEENLEQILSYILEFDNDSDP